MRLVLACLIPCIVVAQAPAGNAAEASSRPGPIAPGEPQPKKPAATPNDLARELLEHAHESLSVARPEAQPYLAWRVADEYVFLDQKKGVAWLEEAFFDAGGIPASDAFKPDLQCFIARSMAAVSIERAAEMLRVVHVENDNKSRDQAARQIVSALLAEQKVDKAIDFIDSLPSPYPFSAAEMLLSTLKDDNDPRRVIVFGRAMTLYQTTPTRDFGRMLAAEWTKLPQPEVIRALDLIVRTVEAYGEDPSPLTYSFSGPRGTASFKSEAAVELFDVEAVLAANEPGKLDEVYGKYPELRQAAGLFPGGATDQSISGSSMRIAKAGGVTEPDANALKFQNSVTLSAEALDMYPHNEMGARALIQQIPLASIRGETLLGIAKQDKYWFTNTRLFDEALDEFAKTTDDDLQATCQRIPQVILAAHEAIAKSKHSARVFPTLLGRAIQMGFDLTDRLYAQDSDGDNPNDAPFDLWPSSNAYREMMNAVARVEGVGAAKYLERVRDSTMYLEAQVALAGGLLDRKQPATTAVARAK